MLTSLLLLCMSGNGYADPPLSNPVPARASDLGFLAGTWRTVETVPETEESWSKPRGGTLMGTNRVIADGQTVFYERLRIEPLGEGLVYQAYPKGAEKETPFVLVKLSNQRAIFANKAHDFPQKLTYTRTGETLTIEVWGPERSFTLEMKLTKD